MDRNQQHTPVIVLIDKQSSGERTEIREWLENSRFSTFEATNVFEALEQLSDFTIESRPDVVLLDVDCCDSELQIVENVSAMPVVTVSHSGLSKVNGIGKYFRADLGKMANRLDELIPYH